MEAAERDAAENSSSDEDEERRRKESQDFLDENDQIELGEEGKTFGCPLMDSGRSEGVLCWGMVGVRLK